MTSTSKYTNNNNQSRGDLNLSRFTTGKSFQQSFVYTPSSKTTKNPKMQGNISRITSPYSKKNTVTLSSPTASQRGLDFSQISSPVRSPLSATKPKNQRPSTTGGRAKSGGRSQSVDYLSYYDEGVANYTQSALTQDDLKSNIIKLKEAVREYEEKNIEKKVMTKVVAQLRSQIAGMQARKVGFAKNFEKIHKEALMTYEQSQNKGNQRALIQKNILIVKEEVMQHDREIQEAIGGNEEVADLIKYEQRGIVALRNEIADMKKALLELNKEKEKVRSDLQISSKLCETMEEKWNAANREKGQYMHHIDNTKNIM